MNGIARPTLALLAAFVLSVCAGGVITAQEVPDSSQVLTQDKPKVTSAKFRVWHVLSTKNAKPRMPKPLEKFAKHLARAGTSHKVIGKPQDFTLKTDVKQLIKMPKNVRPGLEMGSLIMNKDGGVTVTLRPKKPKTKKEVVKMLTRKFPFIVANEKYRVGDETYLLILEKVPPKKKAGE